MMVKKEVLDKTGGFDEMFFMYGEDVDLSYRIQKAADIRIIIFPEAVLFISKERAQEREA